jgi:AbrB family looped-hinge helix DNA binding protein
MTTATVGRRFQVVIPRDERERLRLVPHERVAVEAGEDYVVIRPLRGAKLRGLGRVLADSLDATAYVRKLRREWSGRS